MHYDGVLVADSKETRRNKQRTTERERDTERDREGEWQQTSSAKLVYECWLLGQRPHDKALLQQQQQQQL